MDPRQIAPYLAISPQLSLSDVALAQAAGFRSIIVNRPDGEETGQPTIAQMREAALEAGLGFAAIPVVPGHFTDEAIVQFAQALEALEGPALAYCRSGVRAASLWALSQAQAQGPDAVLNAALAIGYDLAPLRPKLEKPS